MEYPPEINIDQDLFSVAWMVYPEQIHISRHELVLNVYQKVLSDRLIKYPKKFFLEADGEVNACICLLYAINQEMPSHNIEDLYVHYRETIRVQEMQIEELQNKFRKLNAEG